MRRTMTTAVAGAMMLLAIGCSSSSNSGSSGDGQSLSDLASAQDECAGYVAAGEVMSAEQVAVCKNSNVALTVTCEDNETVLTIVAVDSIEYVFIPGQAPQKRAPDTPDRDDRALCPGGS